jgi:hypothetical protein
VAREQLLVGRHHRLAAGQRGLEQLERRVQAAHHLHHDRDVRVVEHARRVGREQRRVDARTRAADVAHQDRAHLQAVARGALDGATARGQGAHHGLPDRPAAEQPHADRGGAHTSRARMSA